MNPSRESQVREILDEAVVKLRALGLQCAIGPLSLPQGYTLNLHVGDTVAAVAAAYVAMGRGGEAASATQTSAAFASEVAGVIAIDAIERAAR